MMIARGAQNSVRGSKTGLRLRRAALEDHRHARPRARVVLQRQQRLPGQRVLRRAGVVKRRAHAVEQRHVERVAVEVEQRGVLGPAADSGGHELGHGA